VQVVIFHSPQRRDMLEALLKELAGLDVYVIDDIYTFGKHNFWVRMNQAIDYCLSSKHDNYLIMPDDVSRVDLNRIIQLHSVNRKMVVNLINDGRYKQWGGEPTRHPSIEVDGHLYYHSDFSDCGIVTNRKSISGLRIRPIPIIQFQRRPNRSSGVGYQMTKFFRERGVPQYVPEKSLVYHGNHESIMHPEERKKNPLQSK
jgi:hypothetical protein